MSYKDVNPSQDKDEKIELFAQPDLPMSKISLADALPQFTFQSLEVSLATENRSKANIDDLIKKLAAPVGLTISGVAIGGIGLVLAGAGITLTAMILGKEFDL